MLPVKLDNGVVARLGQGTLRQQQIVIVAMLEQKLVVHTIYLDPQFACFNFLDVRFGDVARTCHRANNCARSSANESVTDDGPGYRVIVVFDNGVPGLQNSHLRNLAVEFFVVPAVIIGGFAASKDHQG